MATLTSSIDPTSETFQANAAVYDGLLKTLRERQAWSMAGGGERMVHAASRARQDPGARTHRPADRSAQPVPRAVAARRLGAVRQRGPGRRPRHRHRHDPRRGLHDHRQRRHDQGRLVLQGNHPQARPRAGYRLREPPAGGLSRRLRRRQPRPGRRGVSRPGPFRRRLLPAMPDVGRGHSADRGGVRRMHRRRRLYPGAVRRGRDDRGQQQRPSRRTADRQGRHPRDRRSRHAGRRRDAQHRLRRLRSFRARRDGGDRQDPRHRRRAQPRAARPWRHPSRPGAAVRSRRHPRHRRRGPDAAVRPARDHRAPGRWQRIPRIQAALRRHAGVRLRAISRACRSASSPTTACCSRTPRSRARISSSFATSATCRSCSCRTSPASWSAPMPSATASPRIRPSWSMPCRMRACRATRSSPAAPTAPAITA